MSNRSIVPVKLSLNKGDVYTLWAPTWVERGAEWQAFLGNDTHILAFDSPADLLLFLESGQRHDLTSHPAWADFAAAGPEKVVPGPKDHYDLVGVPVALAGAPDYDNVATAAGVFEVAEALAAVGTAETAVIFFSTHSVLRNVQRGAEHYAGPHGMSEWSAVGHAIVSNWGDVLDSLDEVIEVIGTEASDEDRAAATTRIEESAAAAEQARRAAATARAEELEHADPYDTSAWAEAGIDPIKISVQGKSVYTLRTYLDGQPVFLGRFGEIYTFPTRKQLLRWLIENEGHDLARVSTWQDIHAAATAGELDVTVHPDNAYSLTGISDDITKGPEAVDTAQMNRAYELMADAADWAGDDSLNAYLLGNKRFQDYLSYMLGATDSSGYVPSKPYTDKAASWKDLEDQLIKRFSKF